ncbi:hypothetical protein GQ55_5G064000 [Panicum hallii var. hallii]|uniref:Secreted protein n=1 Tax=Panicum hallii var. hallii TaxID=1504633 RepID=A0A2T7DDF4_9POAL|nr:hypothetical protein GQ55_5G064000 [Panicum hallii var. hallii]PUZ53595.1 hypothetical protein GQ55_5G064000 [Panicum hallii var. hallii]PUZ53596.1 hypothetical protein GQ55_5G064000 [Panicum hallii var. hallii]PUZ53597.1 hypothetical protein GQ55_5G064000 [Panicum hallii var. hallii]PUZ53598.1 hypothetical protein GQ55_5G064000 [Panicum hallii var. hallii]
MRVFILIWGVFVCEGDQNPRVISQPSADRGVGVLSVILVQRLGSHRRAHLESGMTGSASHQQLAALLDLVWRKLRSQSGIFHSWYRVFQC